MADEEKKDKKSPAEKPKPKPRAKPAAKSSASKGAAAKPRARKPAAKAAAKEPKESPKADAKPAAKAETAKAGTTKAGTKAGTKAETKPARKPARRTAAKKAAPDAAPDKTPAAKREAPQRPLVRARAKYVRSSARKARLVMDHVRGRSVADARALLRHSPRGVARDVERLLNSAVANAENNHELVGDDLFVKEIFADEGPTLRRFRPRAQGRATRIRKRTSHLTVGLSTKE